MADDWSGNRGPYNPFWPYYGYYDLGPISVPPIPKRYGLTDRATGVVWYLGSDAAEGSRLVLFLADQLSNIDKVNSYVFGAYEGPLVWQYARAIRLGVRNGHLVWDVADLPQDQNNYTAAWARDIQSQTVVYYIQMESGYVTVQPGNHLSYLLYVPTAPQTVVPG